MICYVFYYFCLKYSMMTTKPALNDVDIILKEIGTRIRAHRKSVAKNYEDFADDHDFNKVTISRLENGENFTMNTLIQVLSVLDVSLEEFFKGIK